MPWKVTDDDCVYDAANREIAHAIGLPTARLIAAAPDLLAALEAIMDLDGPALYRPQDVYLVQARAAIAKAKGEA